MQLYRIERLGGVSSLSVLSYNYVMRNNDSFCADRYQHLPNEDQEGMLILVLLLLLCCSVISKLQMSTHL